MRFLYLLPYSIRHLRLHFRHDPQQLIHDLLAGFVAGVFYGVHLILGIFFGVLFGFFVARGVLCSSWCQRCFPLTDTQFDGGADKDGECFHEWERRIWMIGESVGFQVMGGRRGKRPHLLFKLLELLLF